MDEYLECSRGHQETSSYLGGRMMIRAPAVKFFHGMGFSCLMTFGDPSIVQWSMPQLSMIVGVFFTKEASSPVLIILTDSIGIVPDFLSAPLHLPPLLQRLPPMGLLQMRNHRSPCDMASPASFHVDEIHLQNQSPHGTSLNHVEGFLPRWDGPPPSENRFVFRPMNVPWLRGLSLRMNLTKGLKILILLFVRRETTSEGHIRRLDHRVSWDKFNWKRIGNKLDEIRSIRIKSHS